MPDTEPKEPTELAKDAAKDELIRMDPTDANEVVSAVVDTMDRFMAAGSVDRVFSEPIQYGETLIIPAAEVIAGAGFGVGGGTSFETKPDSQGTDDATGGGGGGGGYITARPVAMIVASPERVYVEPVVDATKVALAFLTLIGFVFSLVGQMRRRK